MDRRQFLALAGGAAASALALAGCSQVPGAPVDAPAQATKSWPFEPASATISYPEGVSLESVTPASEADTVDEFWQIGDALTYNSLAGGPQRMDVLVSPALSACFSSGMELLQYALQMGPVSHNFLYDFDLDRYDTDSVASITMSFRDNMASVASADEKTARSVSYVFFRNCLQPDDATLAFGDLPLVRDGGRGYLAATNSEQLFYAVSNGYVPYVEEGTPAHALLARAVGVLARITSPQMGERELYESIYQYVTCATLYDYETLVNSEAHTQRERRVFFLEGSMEDGIAVCDGLTKMIVLLCRLMGVEAYHVGARNGDSAHAYVYVRVDGTWYLSCPTSGIMRMPLSDDAWQSYHTANFMLCDLDTNMAGWEWESLAYEDVHAQMVAEPAALDFWSDTTVKAGQGSLTLAPATAEDALEVLHDARALAAELGCAVEVELLGAADVLRDAYRELSAEDEGVLYLSSGTFRGQRLQTFVFGAVRDA